MFLIAVMFLAGSMACWHLVNYLERHVLDVPSFYKSWEPVGKLKTAIKKIRFLQIFYLLKDNWMNNSWKWGSEKNFEFFYEEVNFFFTYTFTQKKILSFELAILLSNYRTNQSFDSCDIVVTCFYDLKLFSIVGGLLTAF